MNSSMFPPYFTYHCSSLLYHFIRDRALLPKLLGETRSSETPLDPMFIEISEHSSLNEGFLFLIVSA